MRTKSLIVVAALAVTGCAMAPTYDSKVATTVAAARQQNAAEALRTLEAAHKGGDPSDLLLNLERGELLRIDGKPADSQAAFEVADGKVNIWEATAKSNPEKLMQQVGATLAGERFLVYEGQDYEKVMLTTRMAMNRISLGDLDNARVDIKRTHEREAVIQEFRAKQTAAAEEQATKQGISKSGKELDGYPIETLNDPEVLKLKNGYQNALSHYLAGYVYEALNEPGLSAPGYRQAIELRPEIPILEEGLRGLDKRTSLARPRGVTDVLFVIEAGSAPSRQSIRLTIPIPTRKGMVVVPITYPVIRPNDLAQTIDSIQVGESQLPVSMIADFNVMARRALKDEMPGIQIRAAIRAVGKALLQEQLNKQGGWAGIIGNIAAIATEAPADDRMWRFLPERIFLARGFLPPGTYDFRFAGMTDSPFRLTVQGRYMIVPLRVLEGRTYISQPTHFGTVLPVIAEPPPPKVVPVAAPKAAPAKKPPAKTTAAPAKKDAHAADAAKTSAPTKAPDPKAKDAKADPKKKTEDAAKKPDTQ